MTARAGVHASLASPFGSEIGRCCNARHAARKERSGWGSLAHSFSLAELFVFPYFHMSSMITRGWRRAGVRASLASTSGAQIGLVAAWDASRARARGEFGVLGVARALTVVH